MAARTVELFGIARLLAARASMEVEVPEVASIRAVVRALGDACPALVGPVLLADLTGPAEGYTLSVSGRSFVEDLDALLHPNDALLLLPAASGG